MLNKKLVDAINEQITYELYSAHLYHSMESYALGKNLTGFATWLRIQAEEEKLHARFFMDFLTKTNNRFILSEIMAPPKDFKSIHDVFATGLEHEKLVTSRIHKMCELADAEKDYAATSFLKWFVDEQVEEESNFSDITGKIELVGESGGIYFLDKELGVRVFTPPANPPVAPPV